MKSFFLTCALLASSTYGHIQMSNPYPIRSPLNQAATGEKDYSYTNPLSTDGSNYPCKGYANDPFNSVATYSQGETYQIELQGSATHGGGSCQIALSYDQGKTFQVIHSMLGGCPLQTSYNFKVPADAPSGEALLAWSWFNKIGNREMYMNCAQVTIGGGAREAGFTSVSRRDAFSSLPPLFIANVNGPGQCKTIEGQEVNFPLPGPDVEGSLSGTGYECSGSAPFLRTSKSPNTASSSSASPTSDPDYEFPSIFDSDSGFDSDSASGDNTESSQKGPSSTALVHAPVTSSAAVTPSSFSVAQSSAAKVASSSTVTVPTHRPEFPIAGSEDAPCVPGTVICSEDGTSWWLCNQGFPVHMGNVASGTHCVHGAMQRLD
ncbi:hypothetical protein HK57_00702 [Aspergillus ustus]|uniref:Extracellular protein n=1 Tax=Aspergillus ustus TaxID=40382 RepID=A0A0C1E5V1_ASPUT|nr:hypothetical protein HK57_00702 [Aspergillus ustus]